MAERLCDLAKIVYGKSPIGVISQDGIFPVVGTGGVYAHGVRSMFDRGVVVARKGSLGKPYLLRNPFWASDTTYALVPAASVDLGWLYYNLLGFDLTKLNEATGVPSISRDWLAKTCFHNPGHEQQRRIAAILTSIDTAIEKAEALIEKHQQIRAGLMHDLFTRGVLCDGRSRPSPSSNPAAYRRTQLGLAPREWRVRRCVDLCSRVCVGIVIQPARYYATEGIPALRSANVRENEINISGLVRISAVSNALLTKSQIREGDILSVRTGYPGTSAVVPSHLAGANCIDVLISSPGPEVDATFLCHWLNSSFGKEQVLRKQGGLAQQHFNVMQDLLTGKVVVADRTVKAYA